MSTEKKFTSILDSLSHVCFVWITWKWIEVSDSFVYFIHSPWIRKRSVTVCNYFSQCVKHFRFCQDTYHHLMWVSWPYLDPAYFARVHTYAAGPSPLVSEEKWVKYAWLLHHLARLRIPPTFLRPLQQRHGWRTVQASGSQESRQEESDLKWNGGDFGQNNYPLAEASSLTFHWSFAKPWVVCLLRLLKAVFAYQNPFLLFFYGDF